MTTTVVVADGDVIDCTGRNVRVKSTGGLIRVDDGFFTLIADSLNVESNAIIRANQVNGGGDLGMKLVIAGPVDISGSLQADANEGGGTIVVEADGNVTIYDLGNNGLEASGTSTDAPGGQIEIFTDGTVYVYNPLRAESGGSGAANGGSITIEAGVDVITSVSGTKLFVDGRKADAGTVSIIAGNNITLGGGTQIEADGRQEEGNGGGVYLTAGNKVTLNGAVSARGGVNAGGGSSAGGELHIESGCGGVEVNANIDIRAGEFGAGIEGGALEIDTLGDITIGSSTVIDTHSTGNAGDGGSIRLAAGGKITLKTSSTLDARGDTTGSEGDGRGGDIELVACEVEVEAGATVLATGISGGNLTIDAASDGAANPTAMHISGTSSFDTTGTAQGVDGEIWVAVAKEALSGVCETDPNVSCELDADCTVGCTTGQCQGLNPDTDDTLSQFSGETDIREDVNLAGCAEVCP